MDRPGENAPRPLGQSWVSAVVHTLLERKIEMRLTVLNVAYPLAPVGLDAVGGAEQVLTQIDAALVEAGHRSLVLACEGSSTAGELFATRAVDGRLQDHMQTEVQARHRAWVERLVAEHRVDLVHFHGLDFHTYLPDQDIPALVTLHLPAAFHRGEAFQIRRPQTFFHAVSRSQQRAFPAGLPLLPPIENGVPVDTVPWSNKKRDYVVSLGRICPEKGFHLAIAAARRANAPLRIAGRVFPFAAHQDYFQTQLCPRLGPSCEFIGPVGPAAKYQLLKYARALLIASTVPETSSLVAMEALACGTPVIAFPAGALPEIVEHGVTGFLVRDVKEMSEAIQAVDTLEPAVCRETAARRFSVTRMTAQYLKRYQSIAASALSAPERQKEEAYASL